LRFYLAVLIPPAMMRRLADSKLLQHPADKIASASRSF